jgi:hypothetical protein
MICCAHCGDVFSPQCPIYSEKFISSLFSTSDFILFSPLDKLLWLVVRLDAAYLTAPPLEPGQPHPGLAILILINPGYDSAIKSYTHLSNKMYTLLAFDEDLSYSFL